ncbi:Rho-GTPase-activating protein 5 [Fusarium oxysporum f. sp. albedinis]|nr:Rho-GTPase-activating protein 5 [Fusarium oxysporum f. sp. albedinis]
MTLGEAALVEDDALGDSRELQQRLESGAVRSFNLAIKKQSWKSREKKGTWSNKEPVNWTFHPSTGHFTRQLDISPVNWTLPHPSTGHYLTRQLDISPVNWTLPHPSIGHFTRQLDISLVNWTFHPSTGHYLTRQLDTTSPVNWTFHPSTGHFTRQLDIPITQSAAFLNYEF